MVPAGFLCSIRYPALSKIFVCHGDDKDTLQAASPIKRLRWKRYVRKPGGPDNPVQASLPDCADPARVETRMTKGLEIRKLMAMIVLSCGAAGAHASTSGSDVFILAFSITNSGSTINGRAEQKYLTEEECMTDRAKLIEAFRINHPPSIPATASLPIASE
jgi:hypothetical protein